MYAVGIDLAKAKSMVTILSDDGEIIKEPFEIPNTESGLFYKLITVKIRSYICVIKVLSMNFCKN